MTELTILAPAFGDSISTALAVLTSLLGLAVGFVAFRGYRRNDSLPMLFVATGFVMTFWAPVFLVGVLVVLQTTVTFSPALATGVPWALRTAGRATEVIGMFFILYGLAMPIRR